MKNKKEIYSAIFFMFLSVIYLLATRYIKDYNAFVATNVTSKTIPMALGTLLLILSLVELYNEKKKIDKTISIKKVDVDNIEDEKIGRKEVVMTFIFLLAYIVLLNPLGFILSSIIFLIGEMLVLTYKDDRKSNLAKIILLSIIFSLTIYFIFTKGLGLILPRGVINI